MLRRLPLGGDDVKGRPYVYCLFRRKRLSSQYRVYRMLLKHAVAGCLDHEHWTLSPQATLLLAQNRWLDRLFLACHVQHQHRFEHHRSHQVGNVCR